jgi:hypothetical protein
MSLKGGGCDLRRVDFRRGTAEREVWRHTPRRSNDGLRRTGASDCAAHNRTCFVVQCGSIIVRGDAQNARLAVIEQNNLTARTKACDVRIIQAREVEHLGAIARERMVADEVCRKQQSRLVDDDNVGRHLPDGL